MAFTIHRHKSVTGVHFGNYEYSCYKHLRVDFCVDVIYQFIWVLTVYATHTHTKKNRQKKQKYTKDFVSMPQKRKKKQAKKAKIHKRLPTNPKNSMHQKQKPTE